MSREQNLERFLANLAVKREAAASPQSHALSAIALVYNDVLGNPLPDMSALRATQPGHLRHAPTIGETRASLQAGWLGGMNIGRKYRHE